MRCPEFAASGAILFQVGDAIGLGLDRDVDEMRVRSSKNQKTGGNQKPHQPRDP